MNPTRRVDALTTGQIATVVLFVAAVSTDPSVWRIPDVVYEVAFPVAFAAPFGAGLFAAVHSRSAPATGTVSTMTCGALFVLLTLLAELPKSLPGL